jgi:hypothetical protein
MNFLGLANCVDFVSGCNFDAIRPPPETTYANSYETQPFIWLRPPSIRKAASSVGTLTKCQPGEKSRNGTLGGCEMVR